MRILIIEDEPFLAEELADTLKRMVPDLEVVNILYSVSESLLYLSNGTQEIDLIFSDIQLGDGLSFEILERMEISIPVIFCTAYDEFMLEAFKSSGIAYILKPIREESLREALEKYDKFVQSVVSTISQNYKTMLQQIKQIKTQLPTNVMVRYRDRIIPMSLHKIALFYIENGITYIYTFQGRRYVHAEFLDELEVKTAPYFFRVNRQYLIHKKAIKNVVKLFSRKLKLELDIEWEDEILVSKEKKTRLLKWLEEEVL